MFGEYTGLVITAGASVAVALIGAVSMVIAKRSSSPVPIQDVWAENRQLNAEKDVLEQKHREVLDAFNVAISWIERAIRNDHDGRPLPEFTSDERDVIGKVRRAPSPNERTA